MSFSFGFFEEGNNKDGVNCSSTAILQSDGTTPSIPLKRHPPLAMFDGGGDIVYTPVVYGGFNFGKVDVEGKEEAVDKESDIIPGVYEGGNKVWECSVDLTVLLMSQKCSLPSPGASRAIELGCGHGFPGIAALKLGYQQVVFSDLNGEVIESATWPNIYLNCREQMARAVCYSGDWSALSTELTNRCELPTSGASLVSHPHCKAMVTNITCLLFCTVAVLSGSYGDGMFELILSAETLYTEACCKKVRGTVHKLRFIDEGRYLNQLSCMCLI